MQSLRDVKPLLSLVDRAERAALRAERAMAVREKKYGRLVHLDLDDGLAMTPDMLTRLTQGHRGTYIATDWATVAARPEAPPPIRSRRRERQARKRLIGYEPSWPERVFAEESHRRRTLTEEVMAAAHADTVEHERAVVEALAHNAEVQRARRVMAFDVETLQSVVAESGLEALRDSLNGIGLVRPDPGRVVILLDLIHEDDIPLEQITSRHPSEARRERLSEADRRRIHLSAVCAAALRCAGVLVGLLPVERLEVVAAVDKGDGAADTAILQFRIGRRTVESMKWSNDPVTLLRGLGPRMDWMLDRGFEPVPLWTPA